MGILNFELKKLPKGVKICNSDAPFFGSPVSDLWPIESFSTLDGLWIKHVFTP